MSTVNLNNLVATWNDPAVNFRAIRLNAVNTASGAGSLLMEILLNGAHRMSLSRDGVLAVSNQVQAPSVFTPGGTGGAIHTDGVRVGSNDALRFSATADPFGTPDVVLRRDLAAGALAQRNGTMPQVFRIYNTYTNASNNERGTVGWDTNILELAADPFGTGVERSVRLRAGANTATMSTTGIFIVTGQVRTTTGYFGNSNSGTRIQCTNADGVIALYNNTLNDFNRLTFGGTNSAFPAIKRNGTRLDLRLADDSVFCQAAVSALQLPNGGVAVGNIGFAVAALNPDLSTLVPFRASQMQIGGNDVILSRGESDVLSLHRVGNPQNFRVYNTRTDASNHERGTFGWVSNTLRIGTERAGTGLARDINFVTNGQTRLSFTGSTGFLSYNGEGASINCTSEFSTVASQNVFIAQTNTVFSHLTSSAALRIEHGNKKFFPTWIDWSLGGMSHNRWNSGYIDNLFLHNNVTDTNNWERGSITWASNALRIGTEHAGTGVARMLSLVTGGVVRMSIAADGSLYHEGPNVEFNMSSSFYAEVPSNSFFVSSAGVTFDLASPFVVNAVDTSMVVNEDGVYLTASSEMQLSSSFLTFSFGGANAITLTAATKAIVPGESGWSIGNAAQRFTNANIDNLYLHNTYTNASNWERGHVRWVANALEIATERLGTGSARPIIFRTNTVNRFTIGSAGTITAALAASQNFIITGLPTTNPNVAGALWNDGGTLRVSAG